MNPAEFDRKSITIESENKKINFKANGSTVKFEGYLKVYKFEEKDEDLKNILPEVKIGDKFSKPRDIEYSISCASRALVNFSILNNLFI